MQVPFSQLQAYLRRYRAEHKREFSNAHRYVYYSRPVRKWIIVRQKGQMADLDFVDDCPCGYDD